MNDIEIDGVVRDLSHLKEFTVAVPGKGIDGADLRVAVSLGLHTVSHGCQFGEHNMTDENGKPRSFCEDRYAFSLGLPELARRMIEQNYFCWASFDRNRAINYAVIDIAPGRIRELKDGSHQIIYFFLIPEKSGDADVRLVVTSCHRREVVFRKEERRFNMQVLLRTCLFTQQRVPKR